MHIPCPVLNLFFPDKTYTVTCLSSIQIKSCGAGNEDWDRLQATLLEVEAAGTTEAAGP